MSLNFTKKSDNKISLQKIQKHSQLSPTKFQSDPSGIDLSSRTQSSKKSWIENQKELLRLRQEVRALKKENASLKKENKKLQIMIFNKDDSCNQHFPNIEVSPIIQEEFQSQWTIQDKSDVFLLDYKNSQFNPQYNSDYNLQSKYRENKNDTSLVVNYDQNKLKRKQTLKTISRGDEFQNYQIMAKQLLTENHKLKKELQLITKEYQEMSKKIEAIQEVINQE